MKKDLNEWNNKIHRLYPPQYPFLLRQMDKPPRFLDMIGELPPDDHKYLCIVGSRTHSTYGTEACRNLIAGLRGFPIVIVSGLAIGIDSLAHEVALENSLKTVAWPGSGLGKEVLYPSSRHELAEKIVEAGGVILSPFKPEQGGAPWTFPVRNKLMAAMSHATLVIEGRHDSGTMITATAASKFNRDLLVVPGSIFSDLSSGPNQLLRDGGVAVTCSEDILEMLGFEVYRERNKINTLLQIIQEQDKRDLIQLLVTPKNREELLSSLGVNSTKLSAMISELELRGLIKEIDGIIWIV